MRTYILLVSLLALISLNSCEKPEPTPEETCFITDDVKIINDLEDDYTAIITADNLGNKFLEIEEIGGKSFAPFRIECGEYNHEGFKIIVSCCFDAITVL